VWATKATGRTAASSQRKPQCNGEWAGVVEDLGLTSSDSCFYEWKPGLPIHYVKQGDAGAKPHEQLLTCRRALASSCVSYD
jgi:hypothetical protein